MANLVSRRGILAGGAAAAASLAFPRGLVAAGAELLGGSPRRSLRVAHLTDFHIQPELRATEGSHAALAHAMNLKPKPDLVLTGGDHIMDAFAQTEARTRLQWDLFDKVRKDHPKTPLHATLGNHDVWGWNKKDSLTDGSERLWGKKWFADFFGVPRTYHSFDQGGWHFVVLDNVFLTPDGYNGIVDDEQMEWLSGDLAATKRPTLILSHIPLLSVTALVGGYDATTGEWSVGGNVMTKNFDALRKLFLKHGNVKVALSGHTHQIDRVDFEGVSYLCGGAVSGNWWAGPIGKFNPGYRVLDLNDNGTFSEKFYDWGWKPA
jgi:3',5'-cyclic AMP phosphodiesterase CpdA